MMSEVEKGYVTFSTGGAGAIVAAATSFAGL